MIESEQEATRREANRVELLLREPEIVAWLDDYRRPERDEPGPDEPAAA